MLFAVAQASLDETGGGEGVEVLNNEAYTGQPLLNGKYDEVRVQHQKCIMRGRKKVTC